METHPLITVFTPTYNRAYTLTRLYNSLLKQSTQNFEWLIVDDGSTDNTKNLILSFIDENKIDIQYHYKTNGGKHRAINEGVIKAKGSLFCIVDSDDYLSPDALKKINYYWGKIKNRDDFAGVVGLKAYSTGQSIGTLPNNNELECTSLDYMYKYKIKGDRAEVFRVDILLRYPFPEIAGEKFVAEGIVWNRISQKYKLLFFNDNIYYAEYLTDGLTKNSIRLRKKNPQGATMLYAELSQMNIPFIYKLKASINYWRFSFYLDEKKIKKIKKIGMIKSIIAFPFAFLLFLKDNYGRNC